MNQDILQSIQDEMSTFSKGQKKIANFILQSYDKAAFMTARKLGKTVNVSESTVVRFAVELGYEGYPDMQKSLQKMIRNRLTYVQRIELANDRIRDNDVLSTVLQADIEKIRQTLEDIEYKEFERAVELIANAKKVYIIGVRSSASLASFFAFYLSLISDNVVLVSAHTASEMFENLLWVGEGDVVVGVSFPRYSSRTLQAVRFARDRGAKSVSVTDGDSAPLAAISDCTLKARSDMASFVDSLVAPLSLMNALLVAISRKKGDSISKNFDTLEHIWEQYNVYERTE